MREDAFHKAPYRRFMEFIAPRADRFALLCSILEECSLCRWILEIAGKRHIAVGGGAAVIPSLGKGPGSGPGQPALIFTAHYDRVPNSPGANDNGAAVFQLVETAASFRRDGGPLFIFTDGEELSGGESLRNQGSYTLGLYLKENGLGDARIFTFDACGTGDTLIISTAADQLLKNETGLGAEIVRRRVQTLRDEAFKAARAARLEKVQTLPTPFSEDAGFLRAGLAAQTITALPQNEAAAFSSLVRRGGTGAALSRDWAATPPGDRERVPETWRSLNGPGDSFSRLTPEHWKGMVDFAKALGAPKGRGCLTARA
ncbi:MAG: Zn-dependent exopeptidase M28 [Treponema sp.]|jgi:hypothetical protein|nr:Zn-dependent exopeptidase M28 [Treponema sp.]